VRPRLHVVLAAALLVVTLGCSTEEGRCVWVNATVGECAYTPSHEVTGVGPSIGSKYGGVAVTYSTIPSSYVVTFYREDGDKQSVDNYDWWRGCKIGQQVRLGYVQWRWKGEKKWHWSLDSLQVVLP